MTTTFARVRTAGDGEEAPGGVARRRRKRWRGRARRRARRGAGAGRGVPFVRPDHGGPRSEPRGNTRS